MTTKTVMALQLVVLALSLGGAWVGAQVHHVVGGDRGWDPSTDVASWSAGRIFRVGDKIWFTYSAAQESVVELKSKEEYESCDVSNPIRMYTDGIESIELDGQGTRYFASFKPESCRNGLKLNVDVKPRHEPELPRIATSESSAMALAAAPTTPSASTHLTATAFLFFFPLFISCFT